MRFKWIAFIIIIVAIAGISGYVLFLRKAPTETAPPITIVATTTQSQACSQLAKECPDGSYVGPIGPACAFVCPSSTTAGIGTNTTTTTIATSTIPNNIHQLNTPASVSLRKSDIAEIRNESFYFALQSFSSSSAIIQITPVGCWNSFPSDVPPRIRCMIATVPIPPQTFSIGQTYRVANYSITLTQIDNAMATFSVN
jgi:hypothetical protein